VAGKISIIMYHYVRDLKNSRDPEIKGLTIDQFREQLAYLAKHYYFTNYAECKAAFRGETDIPSNSVILSFDDAYSDHYLNVFPLLDEMKIEGWFFPPVKAITQKEVLGTNKIHFVLASANIETVLADVFDFLDKKKDEHNLFPKRYYYAKLAHPNRFDTGDVIFVKRLLQTELPYEVRNELVDILFHKHVTADEKAFSSELYMSVDQIRCMFHNGMLIGSHGYDHFWLNTLTPAEQEREINLSLDFLSTLGVSNQDWIMCYPFGSYDDNLLQLLKHKGCTLGVTTEVGIAEINLEKMLILPRLDTNDIPKSANAPPNQWTLEVIPEVIHK
jgi:peptidoglycan/xylan/chitin deacetylase (PgdA/CDA1 family)